MKIKITFFIFAFLLLTVSMNGQTSTEDFGYKPNFSGVWKLDKTVSPEQKDLKGLEDLTLEISATEAELRVKRIFKTKHRIKTVEAVYYTDNRGEKNPKFRGRGKVSSTTRWRNSLLLPIFPVYNLVVEYVKYKESDALDRTTYNPNDPDSGKSSVWFSQSSKDVWELSADKKTLTITTEIGRAKSEDVNFFVTAVGTTPEAKTFKKVFRKTN